MSVGAENDACVCPPDLCVGVPGDNDHDEPRLACRACLALDPEEDCLRPERADCICLTAWQRDCPQHGYPWATRDIQSAEPPARHRLVLRMEGPFCECGLRLGGHDGAPRDWHAQHLAEHVTLPERKEGA